MNLNKLTLCVLSGLFLSISPVKADINDLILDKAKETTEKLGLSKNFLNALKNCSALKETRNEMGIEVTYEIKGFDDQGNCIMENTSGMQGFSAVSICKFNKENLERFIEGQRKIRESIEKASSLEEILSNPSYMEASEMLLDEDICQNKHTAIDQTKELREHLKNCTPYESSMDLLNRGSLMMKVVGYEGEKCRFIYKMLMKAPSAQEMKKMVGDEMYEKLKDNLRDMETITDCRFTEKAKKEYIGLLEQTVIPAGDSLDIDAIQDKREAQKKAFDYLGSSPDCQISQN